IGEGLTAFLIGPYNLAKIFKVDLVANASARWDNAEIPERLLSPFQETIALAVTLIFELYIALESLRRTELIHDNGMVDHQIDRHQRIDLFRITSQGGHCVSHGCKVHNRRDSGKILHQY